jgi:class 3 adenylate cyclase
MGDDKHNRLTISCPRCEKGYRVKTEWIGRRITCKDCQSSFPIQIDENHIDIESKLHELIIENERIRKEVQGLREKSKVTFKEESLQISVEGLDSMLLRFHQNSIEYVNSTFCKTYKINKEDILGKEKSILKQVIPAPIYKTLETPQEPGVSESKAIDGKGKIYEVRKTYTDQYLDIVFSDVTSQQKFKEYVSKYVSHDLVELDESELQTFRIPERRFMTVSFTDLRGFTAMSETLTPEEVRTTMNAYLEEIIHAINMNKATVDKIVGDEVMALYGAPKYYKDHAFRAIKTGCDQIRNLNALQKVFSKIGKIIPDCGVGINSGDMVLGNMGSSTHQDYTVLGAAVNLAARLCGAAKGAQVVLTESTLHHVIENLPEGWSFKKSKVQTDKHNSEIRGKVESSYELPRELQGLRYVIGPKSKTGIELKYQFDYEYSIKVKGVKNPLPIISVCDFGPTPDEDVLSSNTIAHKGEKVFGKYRLIELIGKGGMGEVWKARDPFGNIFALKMLLAGCLIQKG